MIRMVLLLLVLLSPLPVLAQDGPARPDPLAAVILDAIAEADALLAQGQTDEALQIIFRANDLGIDQHDMDPLVRFLPNLAAARAYRLRFDWAEVERYAASALRALDAPDYALHPTRLEAAGRLGHALNRLGREAEAAAILRPIAEEVMAAGGPQSEEARLVDFWLAATLARIEGEDWMAVSQRVLGAPDRPRLVSGPEFLSLVYDVGRLMRSAEGANQRLLDITTLLADSARAEDVLDIDRAAYLEFHAQVLSDLGHVNEAAALMETELASLTERRKGSRMFLQVGLRLALLWFELGRIDDGIALLSDLRRDAAPDANPATLAYLGTVRGYALEYQGASAEAQAAYRESYALLRQVQAAHEPQALETATLIDRSDPGFADFAFAAELTDAGSVSPSGPPEEVLLRFLSGLYALNQQVLMAEPGPGDDPAEPEAAAGDPLALGLNRVLHLGLSGRNGPMRAEVDRLRRGPLAPHVAAGDAVADAALLYQALGEFWLTGQRVEDAPEIFAALDALEPRLPPGQQSLVRILRVAALNFSGRGPAAVAALRDWIDARAAATHPRDVWDLTAGMIATELAYIYVPRDLADRVLTDTMAEAQAFPGAVLARDYLLLVRLMNAVGDMETDQGLVELAALVQRVSAQLPEGHVLRATTRYGLANALAARDRIDEAQAMMARAADEYRANPGHRADVLAFMQAMQAQMLTRLGRADLALTLARAAYAGLTPQARSDYRLTIVAVLTRELVTQGRAPEALALAEQELANPALIEQLVPLNQLDALRTRAALHRDAGDLARSDALLAEAQALAAAHPDLPLHASGAVLWEQGVNHVYAGRHDAAFRAIVSANDRYTAARQDVARSSASGRAAMRSEDAMRARAEAQLGWNLLREMRQRPGR